MDWSGSGLAEGGVTVGFTTIAVVMAQVFVSAPFYVIAARGVLPESTVMSKLLRPISARHPGRCFGPSRCRSSCPQPHRRRGPRLGASPRRIRCDDHVCRQFPRGDPDHAAGDLRPFGAGDMSTALLLSVVLLLASPMVLLGVRPPRAGDGVDPRSTSGPNRGKRSFFMRLATLPRYPLATLPTPLRRARNLEKVLGPRCPRIYLKRDDLTGLALAATRRASSSISWPMLSPTRRPFGNRRRGAVEPCAHHRGRRGNRRAAQLRCSTHAGSEDCGNLLLDHLLGAEVRIVSKRPDPLMASIGDELRRRATLRDPNRQRADRGRRYVAMVAELPAQLVSAARRRAGSISHGVIGTQAGLVVGAGILGAVRRLRCRRRAPG